MKQKQILTEMLGFSMQQHEIKDKVIEALEAKIAEYEATKQAKSEAKPAKEIK